MSRKKKERNEEYQDWDGIFLLFTKRDKKMFESCLASYLCFVSNTPYFVCVKYYLEANTVNNMQRREKAELVTGQHLTPVWVSLGKAVLKHKI